MAYEGPPDWQQQPGRWQPEPTWHQPPPGYGPMDYPAPPPGYSGYGYPLPVRPAPRVSPIWTGIVMAAGGLIVILGSVMTWAKLVIGGVTVDTVAGTDGARDGKITIVFGAVLIAVGIVVLVRQGRLWAGIVGTVIAAFCTLTALADIGDISDKSDQVELVGEHIEVGAGLLLVLLAAVLALAASIVAICLRRVSG
jgi:hypothetical protein